MLFILAMDPFQKILEMATEEGMLSPIGAEPIKIQTSLYANDAALFLRSTNSDMINLHRILTVFCEATGVMTNITKSKAYIIRCDDGQVDEPLHLFQRQVGQFLGKYLGLPLNIGKVHRADEQILVDRVGGKLPGWKGRLLLQSSRQYNLII